jgi:hypothetical protein
MPARTKGRAKFNFHGRPFIWWVDGDRWLRIASLDKKFVVAVPLGVDYAVPPLLEVIGEEFPGLPEAMPRPVRLVTPRLFDNSALRGMGGWVESILEFAFDDGRATEIYTGDVKFL